MVATWIAAAFALGLAGQRIGLPPLVGFLAAGFALNAAGYGDSAALDEVAHAGVLLLLFTVGLKVRLKNVLRPEVWGTTLLHLALVAVVLAPALYLGAGLAARPAAILALALGFSSTVVAAKILEGKRELRAFHGRVAIGILIVQDLVAVVLLTISDGRPPSLWALALLALPLARPVMVRLLELAGHGELLVLLGMLLAVGVGGLAFEAVGLSPELGALVLGALLADHPRSNELSRALWGLKEVFLVGFFLRIGMSGLPDAGALAAAALLLIVVPLKATLLFVLLPLFRLRARSSFLTAIGLASYSEFALVVAHVGVKAGWLEPSWLVVLALAVALSFAAAAPGSRFAHVLYGHAESWLQRFERVQRHPDDEPVSLGAAEIAIVGMGRVGTGAYDFLRGRQARVVGLDSDPGKVEHHLAEGRRVVYADAEDPGFWHRLRLEGIEAIMLALPDLEAKRFASEQLRRRGYRGLISATNVFPEEAAPILGAGCTTTFNYFDEAGVGFAEHTWEYLHAEGAPPAGAQAPSSTPP